MQFEHFSGVSCRFLALMIALSLPLSAAYAADEKLSPATPPVAERADVLASSCAAKSDVTTVVLARPSDSWVAQSSDWTDSGIVVDTCHTVIITAAGQWRYGRDSTEPLMSGAGAEFKACGIDYKTGIDHSPLPTAPCGALIGKVGAGGKPFLIGDGPTEVPSESEGKLYFIMNDWEFGDNSGSLTVTATFKSPPATASR